MALYAFDGTGNEDRDGDEYDSNVVHFFNAYDDPDKDNDPDDPLGSLYAKGIGRMAETMLGGSVAEVFGIGGHRRVRQAIRRLRNNLRAGDDVVDIVGFSRGAGIAVSFANEVTETHPDLKIRFLGLWDTVGQFGLPGEKLQAGHDLSCPRNVRRCYHAMALDENRALFPLTRMRRGDKPVEGFVECWFRGVHSDVGGGNGNRGMNWISLHWMLTAARRDGLPIKPDHIERNLAHRTLPQKILAHEMAAGVRRRTLTGDVLHVTVQPLAGEEGRPEFLLSRLDDEGRLIQIERA